MNWRPYPEETPPFGELLLSVHVEDDNDQPFVMFFNNMDSHAATVLDEMGGDRGVYAWATLPGPACQPVLVGDVVPLPAKCTDGGSGLKCDLCSKDLGDDEHCRCDECAFLSGPWHCEHDVDDRHRNQ